MPAYTQAHIYTPTRVPIVDPSTNYFTIAKRGPDGKHVKPEDLDMRGKAAFYDLLFSLGAGALNGVPELVHRVHPAYVRQKEDRIDHSMISTIFLLGSVSCSRSMITRIAS